MRSIAAHIIDVWASCGSAEFLITPGSREGCRRRAHPGGGCLALNRSARASPAAGRLRLAQSFPKSSCALKACRDRSIAISYFEWSSQKDQKLVVTWEVIDGPEGAHAVADAIIKAPMSRTSRTSISVATNLAMQIFEKSPCKSARRVIDISGDGPNNHGDSLVAARNNALVGYWQFKFKRRSAQSSFSKSRENHLSQSLFRLNVNSAPLHCGRTAMAETHKGGNLIFTGRVCES